MPTFTVTPEQIAAESFVLRGKDARHITQVLRMGPGEALSLACEDGRLFSGHVASVEPELVIHVASELPAPVAPFEVHLHASSLKKDKLEWVIQKATELNAASVTVFVSKRAIRDEISDNRAERFARIVDESMKQCGRLIPLRLEFVGTFDPESFKLPGTHFFCALSEKPESMSHALKRLPAPYHLWIGPEGGWSAEETQMAQAAGAVFVTLGPLVLRAETACIAAVSLASSHLAGGA